MTRADRDAATAGREELAYTLSIPCMHCGRYGRTGARERRYSFG
jgi:hypothetical protein